MIALELFSLERVDRKEAWRFGQEGNELVVVTDELVVVCDAKTVQKVVRDWTLRAELDLSFSAAPESVSAFVLGCGFRKDAAEFDKVSRLRPSERRLKGADEAGLREAEDEPVNSPITAGVERPVLCNALSSPCDYSFNVDEGFERKATLR
ncbi:hypothetical protein PHSY_004000 [Pseudozyma hubeiensis SY62]|uniref:Uncharacterized protein n=1 Tax=Pseudozyma hubeiensis (strain SY62) TaxID=1305764 RepID=R9PEB2_PSEHS|nr:hypothetical protein PHSY_004000 [Pseudozyma hubeiensis SY62]GAC96420.1 hypothetical protein PHSY_004000 [Pseudozyma hubeiensis SY62]